MKTVGILGGLGPDTTAKFYLHVIEKAKAFDSNNRPPIVIWNVPINLQEELAFISGEDRAEYYVNLLIQGVEKLEAAGADFIVIPCNSVHMFIDQLRNKASVPVLSIVEETVEFLINHHITEVGILATSATAKSNLYSSPLSRSNIKVHSPHSNSQEELDQSIARLMNHEHSKKDTDILNAIISELADSGVRTTLLACTDLQLAALSHPTTAIYDTMNILVESTVREIFN